MGANARVINLTTGARIKRSQARGRVENCISVWVSEGFTIRDLTLAQMVQKRSEAAKVQAGMGYLLEVTDSHGKTKLIAKPYLAELHGLRYEPSNLAQTRQSWPLIAEANKFCTEQAI